MPPMRQKHEPRLLQYADGRWSVRCRECEECADQSLPLGIGVPITNRYEAESILRNHSGLSR